MVGMLSNQEVLAHITAMKARYTKEGQMKSSNLETVMKEVLFPSLLIYELG